MTKLLKDYSVHISVISLMAILGGLITVVTIAANMRTDVANAKEFNKEQQTINRTVGDTLIGINTKLEILIPGYEK